MLSSGVGFTDQSYRPTAAKDCVRSGGLYKPAVVLIVVPWSPGMS
jgi:hypothetical protein